MTSRTAQGYAMVAASYLLIGLSGTLVMWATAPPSLLLVLRFAVAALLLGAVFARRRRFAGLLVPGMWPWLLLMGAFDVGAVLLYFMAIRETGVAVATFFLFVQPVWIALLAPRFLRSATEGAVYAAIGLALAGLAIILVPALSGDGVHASALGLLAGLGSGLSYAGFTLVVKGLMRRLDSGTLVLAECTLDGAFPAAARAVADAGCGLLAHRPRPARGAGAGGGVHGGRLRSVDGRDAPGARAAQRGAGLPRAGLGARVRPDPAGPDRHGVDGSRRCPHPGRGHPRCAAR